MQLTKQRATRQDEKLVRRQQLLAAAYTLIQSTPYEALTVLQIAEQAKLAKGTVYLYFKTKEEIFLALAEQLLTNWFDQLDAHLRSTDTPHTSQTVAQQIGQTLAMQPILLLLLGMLHTVLEVHAEYGAVLAFKRFLSERLPHSGALLEASLPGLGAGGGVAALLNLYALAIGIEHLTRQSDVVRQIEVDHPTLAFGQADFVVRFTQAGALLLRGYQNKEENL